MEILHFVQDVMVSAGLALAEFLGFFVSGFDGFIDSFGKIFFFKCLNSFSGSAAG